MYKSKITEEMYKEIKEYLSIGGVKKEEIAELYGLHVCTISKVQNSESLEEYIKKSREKSKRYRDKHKLTSTKTYTRINKDNFNYYKDLISRKSDNITNASLASILKISGGTYNYIKNSDTFEDYKNNLSKSNASKSVNKKCTIGKNHHELCENSIQNNDDGGNNMKNKLDELSNEIFKLQMLSKLARESTGEEQTKYITDIVEKLSRMIELLRGDKS